MDKNASVPSGKPPGDDLPEQPEQDLPDVSDLKTYDVPDPPVPSGGCGLGMLLMPLGIVAAVFFLEAVAVDHYFAIIGNTEERSRSRERAQEYASQLPPAELLERVLEIETPAVQGAFHAALASTKDVKHVPAIAAYVQSLERESSWRRKDKLQGAFKSLKAFPPEAVGPALLKVAVGKLSAKELVDGLYEELKAYPPEPLIELVLALPSPGAQGRWHWILAASKDPKHIPSIMAYARATGSKDKSVGQSLLAFGKAGTQPLKTALHSKDRREVRLAANALVGVNLEFVTGYCGEQLGAYQKTVFAPRGLAWASGVVSTVERGQKFVKEAKITPQDISAAKGVLAKGDSLSYLIMEMLKSMDDQGESKEVDFCFIHGLSNFNRGVAEYCAKTLQRRLPTNALIDTLFSYIAAKESFEQREVDIYEGLLRQTGTPGSLRVAWNMDRLLEAAKTPEQVFFLYKKMGIKILGEKGTKACLKTLEAYAGDSASYIFTKKDRLGRRSETTVYFKAEVAQAIAKIKARGR